MQTDSDMDELELFLKCLKSPTCTCPIVKQDSSYKLPPPYHVQMYSVCNFFIYSVAIRISSADVPTFSLLLSTQPCYTDAEEATLPPSALLSVDGYGAHACIHALLLV